MDQKEVVTHDMFKQLIKTKQPFATKFLESALTPGREKLANSYMFTGSNTMDMYFLAMETARILNCADKTEDCTCNNCNWTRQNRHPAVITVSPIDYIHANKDSKPKTVITIDQSRYLKQTLSVSSQYHRIIIFTDAKEGKEQEVNANVLWEGYENIITPPVLQNSDKERENWIPVPLSYKTMHSEPANALLKVIEEPPSRVTFFFFTRDKEDMLDTIVSRSQIISLASTPRKMPDLSILGGFFDRFPPKNREEAIVFSERLVEIAKENSYKIEDLLKMIQEYLIYQIKQNPDNKQFCSESIKHLKNIHKAENELKNYVNPQSVMDSLLTNIAINK